MYSSPGSPTPLGPSKKNATYNFCVFSEHATDMYIALFLPGAKDPFKEFRMHQTETVWHIEIQDIPEPFEYAYRADGPKGPKFLFDPSKYLLDPYAPLCNSPHKWGGTPSSLRSIAMLPEFSWEEDVPLQQPLEKTIIYEMHVRGFTKDTSSGVQYPGTYQGVIEKIPYLKDLGITAIELMPVYEFNERSHRFFESKNPLYNFWGYSTVSFFAPMNRFATENAATEMKRMVKALHAAGIEVILDVVYNHTNEGDSKDYHESFRGLDNAVYYMLTEEGKYYNYSGCGNTINCNNPAVRRFIIDSLVYWVEEYHIDGFRFDLASILTRAEDGAPLSHPPLIEEICAHPKLMRTKLIAEAWDCGGLHQVGSFPRGDRFSEWNGIYRDTVRKYIKGEAAEYMNFKDSFLGSPNIYPTRGAKASINFITAHDGFTLYDLTAYNEKHNEMNREQNQDGHSENESWNCGIEGETTDTAILDVRSRQMYNFLAILFLSKGIPMLLMGDEYGHTRYGNNNAWCHDNFLNYFLWNKAALKEKQLDTVKTLIQLRKRHCMRENNYIIHETDDPALFLCTINDSLFFALNVSKAAKKIILPTDFKVVLGDSFYQGELKPHASLVAEKRNI